MWGPTSRVCSKLLIVQHNTTLPAASEIIGPTLYTSGVYDFGLLVTLVAAVVAVLDIITGGVNVSPGGGGACLATSLYLSRAHPTFPSLFCVCTSPNPCHHPTSHTTVCHQKAAHE